MKPLYFLVILGYFTQLTKVLAQISNLTTSLETTIAGVGQDVGNILPEVSSLLEASPQVLFGLPEIVVLTIIHHLCSILLNTGSITPLITPDVDKMSLRFHAPSCKELSIPLSQAEKILEIPEFESNKKVAIFVSGWMSSGESEYIQNMADAFNCRGDYNFLALNTSDSINTFYSWSAFNTEEIGRQFAKVLEKMVEKIPVENIHLIGHSLGAHIVGYTGRYFTKYTDLNLTRITGLDPANPCFNEGETLTGIQRGDAQFIDIIHTNPGGFGKANPLGDADFYAGGLDPIKSGCIVLGCSHIRAIEFFTESIYPGNQDNFLAARCPFYNIKNTTCDGSNKYSMGLASSHDLKGTYVLMVNAEPPYGKNNKGKDDQCKQCHNE